MQEYLNSNVVANLAQMLRSSFKGALWICDAEEAARFFEARCTHSDTKVIVAPKASVEVLKILLERGLQGVVATTSDPTYEGIAGAIVTPGISNLLANSNNLIFLFREAAGSDWLNAFTSIHGIGPVEAVEALASRLCQLSSQENLNLNVIVPLAISYIYEHGKLPGADETKAICCQAGYDKDALDTTIDSIFDADHKAFSRDFSYGTCGIKLVTAFLNGIRPHGLMPVFNVSEEASWSLLRTHFAMEEFERTSAFWELLNWQQRNGYSVFREWRILDAFGLVWDQRYWNDDLCVITKHPRLSRKMAVMKMDLDNFKGVNTELGHSGGDEAIKLYLSLVNEILQGHAHVYRRGGDEVVAIALDANSEHLPRLVEKLRHEIEVGFLKWSDFKGITVSPTVSIGLVFVSQPNVDDIVVQMDRAQEKAKASGKNRVVVVPIAA